MDLSCDTQGGMILIFWEVKKIVKSKIGVMVLLLFIFLCGVMSVVPVLEGENSYGNDKYELVEDIRPAKEFAEAEFNEKIQLMEENANTYVDDASIKRITEVARDNIRLMKYKEYKNVDFYLALNTKVSHPAMTSMMVILLMLLFSNIYTEERVSGVDSNILSSEKKYQVLYAKLALAVIFPVMMYGIYIGIEYLVTLYQYGSPIFGELEAFRIVNNGIFLNFTFTIHEYLMLKVGTMTLLFVSVAVFSSLISFISANSLTAISGTVVFLLLGKVCTLLKFLPSSVLSIISAGNYVDLILLPDRFIGMYTGTVYFLGKGLDVTYLCNGMLITMLFAGIVLCIFTFKKVLTRSY